MAQTAKQRFEEFCRHKVDSRCQEVEGATNHNRSPTALEAIRHPNGFLRARLL